MTLVDVTRLPVNQAYTASRFAAARAAFLTQYGPVTRKSYADGLTQWARWCAHLNLDPLDVERHHLDLWARWLEEDQGRKASTVAHRLVTLRSFYRYCEEEGFVDRSPAARVRLPRVPAESSTIGLSRPEVAKLLAVSERSKVAHAMVCLLVLNGLRISEACGANIDDLGVARGHRVLTVRRKGGKVQTIPLSPKTARALDAIIGERTAGPILLTQAGTRMTRQNAGKTLERLGRSAGIVTHVHPHQLRHAFVTIALDAGVPLHDVQDSAGHSDPRVTQRYNRNRFALDKNATHIVTAFVAGG